MRNRAWMLAAILAVGGCGKPTPAPPEEDAHAAERRRAVLADLADKVIVPAYEDFAKAATDLHEAAAAWSKSGDLGDRAAAQTAWVEAMHAWEITEAFQVGPAAAMSSDPGGRDLRDRVYSWPTTNPCRVDQELVEQSYADAESFAAEAVNVKGLDALEYLLFHEGAQNQCDPTRSINADGSWEQLDEAEIAARRAAYAEVAAADVAAGADAIVAAWRDGFRDELAMAGSGSETFPSTQEALNATSNAMFYIEFSVKDMKLAEPLGLMNCDAAVCPEAREFVWNDVSFSAIEANLEGFERVFSGGDGLGFDDLLLDVGQDDLARDIADAIDAAASEVTGTETTMGEALAGDPAPVQNVHGKVKALTDLLKTQFVSVLDLELPHQAEGDND